MEQLPSNLDEPLRRGLRRVLVSQALLTTLLAVGFGVWGGWYQVLAALFGGVVALSGTGWLGWSMRRAGDPRHVAAGMGPLYSGVVIRYGMAIVLLALGLGVLRLAPLPMLVVFGLAQFGFYAGASRR